jgi:PTS system galactitol-specific IIA component
MQYTLKDLLSAEHILVDGTVANSREAIEWLSQTLIQSGNVTPEFIEDVWKREQVFPTGLPTAPFAIAVPHADPDHVDRTGMAVGVLKAPVEFAQMGTDGSVKLQAQILFLLAIKESEKQVEMIGQLMSLIQSADLLTGLANTANPEEAFRLIQNALG